MFLEVEVDNRGESESWDSLVALYLCRFRCDDIRAAHPSNSHFEASSSQIPSRLNLYTWSPSIDFVQISNLFYLFTDIQRRPLHLLLGKFVFIGEYGVKNECDDAMSCTLVIFWPTVIQRELLIWDPNSDWEKFFSQTALVWPCLDLNVGRALYHGLPTPNRQ